MGGPLFRICCCCIRHRSLEHVWACFVEGLFVACVLGSLTGKEKLAEEGFLNKSHSGFSFFLFLFF